MQCSECLLTPQTFYATQIINPFLNYDLKYGKSSLFCCNGYRREFFQIISL